MHEYLACEKNTSQAVLQKVKFIYGGNGARSKNPDKFLEAAALLKQGLKNEPDNSRYVLYLAESLRDSGNPEEALEFFEKRVTMGGWEEEVFWSLLQIAQLKRCLNFPLEEIIESYYRAHRYRPHRAEPIYYLAEIYNQQGNFVLAYESIKGWECIPKPEQKDILIGLDWIIDYGLSFQYSLSAYYLGYHQEFAEKCDQLLALKDLPESWREQVKFNRNFVPHYEEDKTVMIAILAKNKEHVLPTFLNCIEALDYDKKKITIYINTNNNCDHTQEILEEWIRKNGSAYQSILLENQELEEKPASYMHAWTPKRWKALGNIRNRSLQKAKVLGCDFYFVVDCDNFIAPYTLKELIQKDKPIIAPLLRALPNKDDPYSNFFVDVDEKGYYKHHPDYFKILNGEKRGVFKVPVVHQAYLIKTEYIDRLNYIDTSEDWEFIVFSRYARNNQIDQYICNEKDFGTFLHFSNDTSLEEEKNIWSQLCKTGRSFQYFDPPQTSQNQNEKSITLTDRLYAKAQLLQSRGELDAALSLYEKIIERENEPEKKYMSLLQMAHVQERCKLPPDLVISSYQAAHQCYPSKIEPLYFLSRYYREIGKCCESYFIALKGLGSSVLQNISQHSDWMSDYGMLWEFSLAAQSIGNFQEAIDVTNRLLEHSQINESLKGVLRKNLSYYIAGVQIFDFAKKRWGAPPWDNPIQNNQSQSTFTKPQSPSKLHICTYASENNQNLSQLLTSCHYQNLNIDVLGLGQSFSFGKSLRAYKEYLENLPDKDVVLFVDAYDVLLLADEKTLLKKFYSLDVPYIFSAEKVCHPFLHIAEYYPSSPTPFKYLNSGSYMGYVCELKQIFEAISPIPDETDDQGLFSVYFLYHPHKMQLDYFGDLFLTLHQVEADQLNMEIEKKTLCFSMTGKYPCVVHGNGMGKVLYQEIYDHFFDAQNPLKGRIPFSDKRYATFKQAFQLMEERNVKTIVETGTARGGLHNFEGDGGSTILFSDWVRCHPETHLYSVDLSKENLMMALEALEEQTTTTFICDDSIHFLQNCPQTIDFLYLDSFDFDYTHPEPSQEHHLKEIEAAYDKLSSNCIVMIDDCDLPYGGKGKLAIEFLLERGWKKIADSYQVILSR